MTFKLTSKSEKQKQKMADVEARREARRRKILQNSENRLKRITGVEVQTDKPPLTDDSANNQNELNNIIKVKSNANVQNERNSTVKSRDFEVLYENTNISTNSSVESQIGQVEVQKDTKKFYISPIIIIPIMLSVLMVIGKNFDLFSVHLNKIFVPLIVYEITTYFTSSKAPNHIGNYLTPLLIFLMPNSRINYNNISKILQILLNFMNDLMIYFFVFIISFYLLQFMIN